MAAWKRAVVTGERKAVARCRFQPERTQATSKALIRGSQKGRRGVEELSPVIRLQSSEPCMPASGQAELRITWNQFFFARLPASEKPMHPFATRAIWTASMGVTLLGAAFNAPVAAQSLDGLWMSDGYGELAEIHGDSLSVFEITSISCVPSSTGTRKSGATGERAGVFTVDGDLVHFLPGASGDDARVHFDGAVSDISCTGSPPSRRLVNRSRKTLRRRITRSSGRRLPNTTPSSICGTWTGRPWTSNSGRR